MMLMEDILDIGARDGTYRTGRDNRFAEAVCNHRGQEEAVRRHCGRLYGSGTDYFPAAAEAKNSPVIMQTTPGTIKYAGVDYYYANVAAAAARSKVPVVMHLDHGDSFDRAMAAYRAGYTSIMIDGSKLSLEENIALTKSVVDACHPGGVSVEGELGKVGGKEDDLDGGDDNPYTDPDEAKIFVEE